VPDDASKAGFPDLPPLPEPDAEWNKRYSEAVFVPPPPKRSGSDRGTVEGGAGGTLPRSPVHGDDFDDPEEAEAPRQDPDRSGDDLPSGAVEHEAGGGEPPPSKPGRNGRGRGKNRRGLEPPTHCPGCGIALGTELQVEAYRILGSVGRSFDRTAKKNWREAFSKLSHTVSGSLDVLVTSRVVSLEAAIKLLVSIHTMLGQPKLHTAQSDGESPLDQLSKWMNSDGPEDELAFVGITDGKEESPAS
jgi:hypothetical protein